MISIGPEDRLAVTGGRHSPAMAATTAAAALAGPPASFEIPAAAR